MLLVHPDQDDVLASISRDHRSEVFAWHAAFQQGKGSRQVSAWFSDLGRRFAVSPSAAKEKFYRWKKLGQEPAALVDRRKVPTPAACPSTDPRFLAFVRQLLERNDRSTKAAFRELKRRWAERLPIPAYEDFPGWPALPHGWSERNLYRKASKKYERVLIRTGRKSAASLLPQVLTTRVGLWPGSHLVFDDVWHDNFVRVGTGPATRVLELGCLDLFSASRFAWGAKPRMPKDGGGRTNLTEAEMRFFVANILSGFGYSARGTVLVVEGGTATIREALAAYLSDISGGLIKVDVGGVDNRKQLIGWSGRGGGNPRHKAALESFHNLLHNELACLPAPTGHDRQQPEASHGLVAYQNSLSKLAGKIPADLAARLAHPIIDFHQDFLPFISRVYPLINERTNHALEGWMEAGLLTTEYTALPGSDQWLQLETLPAASRALIVQAAASDPDTWSRRRRLSPAEVLRQRDPQDRLVLSEVAALDIIGPDQARERRVEGSYIEVQDQDISPETMVFEARLFDPRGRDLGELTRGERYACFVNPYNPEWLAITDAKGRYLGKAPRLHRACKGDDAAVQAAIERARSREADLTAAVTARHRGSALAAEALRTHNARVFEGAPITAAERQSARADAAHRAATTRALDTEETAAAQAVLAAAHRRRAWGDDEDDDDLD